MGINVGTLWNFHQPSRFPLPLRLGFVLPTFSFLFCLLLRFKSSLRLGLCRLFTPNNSLTHHWEILDSPSNACLSPHPMLHKPGGSRASLKCCSNSTHTTTTLHLATKCSHILKLKNITNILQSVCVCVGESVCVLRCLGLHVLEVTFNVAN